MSQNSITTALFSTEKQGALFDVGEPSPPEAPPVSLRRPVYLRSRLRVVYIQTGLAGVDEFAAEKRRLAEWGGPDGFCPRRDAGSNVCWWLSCRYHLRNDLGNESANISDQEIVEELGRIQWHCVHHWVEDHPDDRDRSEEACAEALGIQRTTFQDRLSDALAHATELAEDAELDD